MRASDLRWVAQVSLLSKLACRWQVKAARNALLGSIPSTNRRVGRSGLTLRPPTESRLVPFEQTRFPAASEGWKEHAFGSIPSTNRRVPHPSRSLRRVGYANLTLQPSTERTCSLGDLGFSAQMMPVATPRSPKEPNPLCCGSCGARAVESHPSQRTRRMGHPSIGGGDRVQKRVPCSLHLLPASEFAQKRDLGHPLNIRTRHFVFSGGPHAHEHSVEMHVGAGEP
jgi:hypothetical protein